jgi:hypothetical protein
MLWDVLYFLDWLICELQELELELEQQELEELGFVGYAEFIDSPDWMDALDLELYMANHYLVDNLMLH